MIKLVLIILIFMVFGAVIWYVMSNFYQQPADSKKVYKIGIIQTASNMDDSYKGFKDNMKKLGFTEGENVVYFHNNINSDTNKANAVATNYVQEGVDVIVSMGILPTKAAQIATANTNIP